VKNPRKYTGTLFITALRNAWRSLKLPSSLSLAIMVFAARADPRLITRLEADTDGRCDIETRGPARYDMRWKTPISTMSPVRKSIKNTVVMVKAVASSVSARMLSIFSPSLILSGSVPNVM